MTGTEPPEMVDLPRATVEIVVAPEEPRPSPSGDGPPAAELRAALLEACTSAAGGSAQCVDSASAAPAAAAVIVTFRGSEHAHVEVSGRRGGAPFGSRELDFLPSDARIERYRTVGYSAGTLVAEYLADVAERERLPAAAEGGATSETPPPGSPPSGPPRSAGPEPAAPRDADGARPRAPGSEGASAGSRSPPRAYVDLGVVHGTAFEGGGMRTGGSGRFAWLFGSAFATASVAYAVRARHAEEPYASFLVASAGAGYFVPFSVFEATARAEAVVERLAGEGETPSGRTGSASRILGAARVGADIAWLPLPALGLVAGADVLLRAAPTELVVEGRTVATVPVVDYTFTGGLRLSFR